MVQPYVETYGKHIRSLVALGRDNDTRATELDFGIIQFNMDDVVKVRILIEIVIANSHLESIDHIIKSSLSHEVQVYGYDTILDNAEAILDILDRCEFENDYLTVYGWRKGAKYKCVIIEGRE